MCDGSFCDHFHSTKRGHAARLPKSTRHHVRFQIVVPKIDFFREAATPDCRLESQSRKSHFHVCKLRVSNDLLFMLSRTTGSTGARIPRPEEGGTQEQWVGVVLSINSSGYFISTFAHPLKYKLPVTDTVCYTSSTFDEKLHQHISHELADHVGRASDTS